MGTDAGHRKPGQRDQQRWLVTYADWSSEMLFNEGEDLIERDDRRRFEACVEILRRRALQGISGRRRARRWLARLLEVRPVEWLPEAERRHLIVTTTPAAALTSPPVTVAGAALYFKDGIEGGWKEMIRQATRSIVLSTYAVSARSQDSVWTLLKWRKATSPGLSIEVFVDWRDFPNACAKRPRAIVDDLVHHRISVIRLARNHSKIVIVDGRLVMIGSGNLEKCFTDAALRFESPALAQQLDAFLRHELPRCQPGDRVRSTRTRRS